MLRKRGGLLLLTLILTAALAAGCGKTEEPGASPAEDTPGEQPFEAAAVEIGAPAPGFALTTTNGNRVALEDYRGQVVVINFWGSWCPPCIQEMPHLQAFYEHRADYNAELLAVNIMQRTDTSAEVVKDFLDANNYTFPALIDEGSAVTFAYQVYGVPETVIVDEEGIVRYLKQGPFVAGELEAILERL